MPQIFIAALVFFLFILNNAFYFSLSIAFPIFYNKQCRTSQDLHCLLKKLSKTMPSSNFQTLFSKKSQKTMLTS